MSIDRMHIMNANNRLIKRVTASIYHDATFAWEKVYSSFCKRHGELMPNKVMQFKYKGTQYKLAEDVMVMSGVRQLHESLVPEFENVYAMFVSEVDNEKRILQNILSHAIRIAKYSEDLIELLPEVMHEAIIESGFFQSDDKPYMSTEQSKQFQELYSEHFGLFDVRKAIGLAM